MEKYKKLATPPLDKDSKVIQKAYCDSATECIADPDCEGCLYDSKNNNLFNEWLNDNQCTCEEDAKPNIVIVYHKDRRIKT